MDWYDILCLHLRVSEAIRIWFATKVLLAHPHRFSEYLLECPSADVRAAFSKIIIFLSHYALMEETQVEVQQSSGTTLVFDLRNHSTNRFSPFRSFL